jgi:hypothetical protein
MKPRSASYPVVLVSFVLAVGAGGAACSSGTTSLPSGGPDSGPSTETCTVTANANGSATVTCPDGTKATTKSGADGTNGTSGANGMNGASGQTTLVKVGPVPPGANCANGGEEIETGIDTNGDGMLEPSEVMSTSYVCNGGTPEAGVSAGTDGGSGIGTTLSGSYTINNSLDVTLIAGITKITGDLNIVGAGIESISLPNLAEVGGRSPSRRRISSRSTRPASPCSAGST